MKYKQCFVCGVEYSNITYDEYHSMTTVLRVYQVCDYVDICKSCGDKASSFVNYHGHKKDKDVIKLYKFLASGVLPQRQFQAQMNGGYYA